MDDLKILRAQCVECTRDSSVVRADCQIQIAGSLIEKESHPNRHEACRDPRVVVIDIRQMHVDEAKLVQLPHSISGEVRRSGKADVPAAVSIDEEPSMIEPRLGHDDRRERIGDKREAEDRIDRRHRSSRPNTQPSGDTPRFASAEAQGPSPARALHPTDEDS